MDKPLARRIHGSIRLVSRRMGIMTTPAISSSSINDVSHGYHGFRTGSFVSFSCFCRVNTMTKRRASTDSRKTSMQYSDKLTNGNSRSLSHTLGGFAGLVVLCLCLTWCQTEAFPVRWTSTTRSATSGPIHLKSITGFRSSLPSSSILFMSSSSLQEQPSSDLDGEPQHPAVVSWPDKYKECGGLFEYTHPDTKAATTTPTATLSPQLTGPRPLHSDFVVIRASPKALEDLDVEHWPVWTTGDKPKWAVGNRVSDKIMPYGELSFVLQGSLEIQPTTGNKDEPSVLIEPGHLVTFPPGFQASWTVKEELTWKYYLY